jgi:hypothetical protein
MSKKPLQVSTSPATGEITRYKLEKSVRDQFADVFKPMLARDPQQFLEQLRLAYQNIVNRLTGDGEGFSVNVAFSNIPEDLGR